MGGIHLFILPRDSSFLTQHMVHSEVAIFGRNGACSYYSTAENLAPHCMLLFWHSQVCASVDSLALVNCFEISTDWNQKQVYSLVIAMTIRGLVVCFKPMPSSLKLIWRRSLHPQVSVVIICTGNQCRDTWRGHTWHTEPLWTLFECDCGVRLRLIKNCRRSSLTYITVFTEERQLSVVCKNNTIEVTSPFYFSIDCSINKWNGKPVANYEHGCIDLVTSQPQIDSSRHSHPVCSNERNCSKRCSKSCKSKKINRNCSSVS